MVLQAQQAASDEGSHTSDPSPLGAFVTDELIAGGFLRQLLQPFLEEVLSSPRGSREGNARLQTEASRLQAFVQQAFGWTRIQELRSAQPGQPDHAAADDEEDNEAPVVVDLGEPYGL